MRNIAGLIVVLLLALPAAAQEYKSEYTDVDLSSCTLLEADDMGGVWACPGLRGYPLMIAEGDLRMYVSYGFNAGSEKAAEQTLPPFNRLGAKMEWLLYANDASAPPVATILRWYTQREAGDEEGQVLVVTQLAAGATCQIAWIDARANKKANELARQAAAELAGDFDCEDRMPQIYGEFTAFDVE